MLHFGTDGVRGVALDELTTELVSDLGRAIARVLQPAAIVVGRDTRQSGPTIEAALIQGITAEGVPVHALELRQRLQSRLLRSVTIGWAWWSLRHIIHGKTMASKSLLLAEQNSPTLNR